ncbi:MAG: signal transduction histidine kinase [Candidatus Endobugula sp.]|jgi:signal transduction histidine kinase
MWRSLFGKYKEMVAAIAVFLVLDAGVLLLNFYTSYQIADDARAMHLANRQSMLTQRIFHSVDLIHDDLQAGRDIEKNQRKLSVSYKQFDEVLDAFIYGGSLIGQGQGQESLLLDDSYQALSDQYLSVVEALWQPYRRLVGDLVYADYSENIERDKLLEKSQQAIDFSREKGDELLTTVSDFAVAVESKAHQKTIDLRLVQGIAICLAVINFFIILFHFLKRLNASDQKAKRSQDEMSEIMRTVRDGLFLLTPQYEIGSQYSASMQYLFRQEDFSNVGFFDLLSPLVSGDDLLVAKDYVDSLFNPRVKSSLMDELNPLQEVRLNITNKYGTSDHFFEFSFSRVFEKEKIIHLMVSVKDITENVELREKLAVSNSRISQETESVLSLMNVDSQLLVDFMCLLDEGVKSINEELEKRVYSSSSFVAKLDKINRIAHSLKGEASMLNLSMVEKNLHALEDNLVALNGKNSLEGDDFLPIAVELAAIVKASHSIRLFMARFSEMAMSPRGGQAGLITLKTALDTGKKSALGCALTQLVDKISRENKKEVLLDLSLFDESLIPEQYLSIMKNIIIQLLRNAVIHGLEKPEKRVQRGKSKRGVISIAVKEANGAITVVVKDDGRGIDFTSIKKHLISQQTYTQTQVEQMTPRDLVKVIFKPGYSTAKKVDSHAGRGVGLDVVKTYINSMNASLSVGCKAKRSAEFRISIPLKNTEKTNETVMSSQCA